MLKISMGLALFSMAVLVPALMGVFSGESKGKGRGGGEPDVEIVKLPKPLKKGKMTVTEALWKRRTVRTYKSKSLDQVQLGRILWAAQGINDRGDELRTVPSAGALYPLEVYALVLNKGVKGLDPGAYHYRPASHDLVLKRKGNLAPDLSKCGYSQRFFAKSPLTLIIAADYERTTWKYDDRGIRYVDMEAGHAAQNVYLQAAGLGLAVGAAGAFQDAKVSALIPLPPNEKPLYILSIGHPR